MPSDPRATVRLNLDLSQFRERLADTVQAFADFAAAVAFATLPTAERWVAGMPRMHYADHLNGPETEASDA